MKSIYRREYLGRPLRIGPWWLGLIILVPLTPLVLLVVPFESARTAYRTFIEVTKGIAGAAKTLWLDH